MRNQKSLQQEQWAGFICIKSNLNLYMFMVSMKRLVICLACERLEVGPNRHVAAPQSLILLDFSCFASHKGHPLHAPCFYLLSTWHFFTFTNWVHCYFHPLWYERPSTLWNLAHIATFLSFESLASIFDRHCLACLLWICNACSIECAMGCR